MQDGQLESVLFKDSQNELAKTTGALFAQALSVLPTPIEATEKENTSFGVLEHALVKDALFVVQGISGKYVVFNTASDSFAVDPQVLFPIFLFS